MATNISISKTLSHEGIAVMTPHLRPKAGFTLVELLVVIAIIGVLMGLLLPAVQSAREAGRRVTCTNNQYQMALAASRFNDSMGYLPGWRNSMPFGTGTAFPSWPVMILPYAERSDIYRSWAGGAASTAYLSLYVCPSTPADSMTNPILSYAGNCGSGSNAAKADGVMLDTTITLTGATNGRRSLDDISAADGTAMTVIFSEKCISGTASLNQNYWDVIPTATLAWANPSSTYAAGSAVVPGFGIVGTASVTKVINSASLGSATVAGQVNLPSSNHPGGAVVAFCDGHTGFLKDSLSQNCYAQLLSSNNALVSGTGAAWRGTYNVLSEGDFQ